MLCTAHTGFLDFEGWQPSTTVSPCLRVVLLHPRFRMTDGVGRNCICPSLIHCHLPIAKQTRSFASSTMLSKLVGQMSPQLLGTCWVLKGPKDCRDRRASRVQPGRWVLRDQPAHRAYRAHKVRPDLPA